jgi:molybdate transport system substrate-binding protein
VRAGLWEKIEPKIVYAENIVQALQFVQTGNAETGFVSRSSTQVVPRPNLEVGAENRPTTLGGLKVIEVDATLYDPIIQSLGVVMRSQKRAAAEEFVRFLMGEEGRTVFESHGFKPPPDSGAGPGAP